MANEAARYFTDKLREFAMHVSTVVFDTALGGLWLVGEYFFENYLVPKLQIKSPISNGELWAFRGLFAVSTLFPFASQVLKHVRIRWVRDRAEERLAKAEASSGEAEGRQK